jgi:hydroxymethylglutaryl-CoA lyase
VALLASRAGWTSWQVRGGAKGDSMAEHITICEVGTRDGFQIEPEFIPTDLKIEAVNRLSAVGIPRLEVTSFVHPKVVPQLRDAEEVMARMARRPGTVYAALVTNDKGAKRAVDTGVENPHRVVSKREP